MCEEEIDEILLANLTHKWRKMSFVIGITMGQIDASKRVGRNDLFFAERLALLAGKNLIEFEGDLSQIRECEIKLRGE
jgi:hypothetical protein